MEVNEKQRNILEKIDFYRKHNLPTHIVLVPEGFKNGKFESELMDNTFFWFFDFRFQNKIRLFLSEIYDVTDYKEKGGEHHG